jgi:uncharacterized membrane protein YdjX (TVP38/TMEM64 family)
MAAGWMMDRRTIPGGVRLSYVRRNPAVSYFPPRSIRNDPHPARTALKQTRQSLLLAAGALAVILPYLALPALRAEVHSVVLLVARADIAPVRDYLLAFGWWAPVISIALQVLTSVIAPLPSFVLAFVNAMLFGFWWGALLTWSSALLAAALCFAMSRVLGRPAVERFVPARALEGTDRFFVRHGVLAVLVARLIPFVNPDVVSYAAGLTSMRWRLFMLSIAVGSLPSTALYSWLGARGVTQVGWLLIPLVVLGLAAMAGALVQGSRRKNAVA